MYAQSLINRISLSSSIAMNKLCYTLLYDFEKGTVHGSGGHMSCDPFLMQPY